MTLHIAISKYLLTTRVNPHKYDRGSSGEQECCHGEGLNGAPGIDVHMIQGVLTHV